MSFGYKRALLKLSGGALTGGRDVSLDPDTLEYVADEILGAAAEGLELGVVIGGPIAYFIVSRGLGPEAWKGFGALAGSWIGGTGNMLAVGQMVELDESSLEFGYAVIADNAV